MKSGRLECPNLAIYLGLSCIGVAFDTFSNIGPVYYISSVTTGFNPDSILKIPYSVAIFYDLITGVADIDQPVGMKGILISALCGEFANAYHGAKCITLHFTQVNISNPFII